MGMSDECYECDKTFDTEWALKQHYVQSKRHHYCLRCDEHFDDDDERRQHMDDNHWWCEECGKVS